jgi:acid phosphatase
LYNSVVTKPHRLANIKNTTLFFEDLEADKLPQWMFISMCKLISTNPQNRSNPLKDLAPNMTSDGHDTSVTVAGEWLKNFLAPLLKNKKFMKNTLILITFDENETYTSEQKFSYPYVSPVHLFQYINPYSSTPILPNLTSGRLNADPKSI